MNLIRQINSSSKENRDELIFLQDTFEANWPDIRVFVPQIDLGIHLNNPSIDVARIFRDYISFSRTA